MTHRPNTVVTQDAFQQQKGIMLLLTEVLFFVTLFKKYLIYLPPRSAQKVISQPTPDANEVSIAFTKFPKRKQFASVCDQLNATMKQGFIFVLANYMNYFYSQKEDLAIVDRFGHMHSFCHIFYSKNNFNNSPTSQTRDHYLPITQ